MGRAGGRQPAAPVSRAWRGDCLHGGARRAGQVGASSTSSLGCRQLLVTYEALPGHGVAADGPGQGGADQAGLGQVGVGQVGAAQVG